MLHKQKKLGLAMHVILIAAAITAIISVPAGAAPLGSAFTYQGQLKNSGSPANGNFNMIFSLWDDSTAGNQVGPPLTFDGIGGNPAPVSVASGLFTVSLDFGAATYDGDQRWLEITVDGTTLSPRQPLTATPYAMKALSAPGDGTGPWSLSGTDAYFDAGNVGVGTSTPTSKLSVLGNADISGNVGIGTSSPAQKLSVAGTIESTSGGFKFPDGSTQTIAAAASQWTANANDLSNNNSGNVGIGTASPATKLDVAGKVKMIGMQMTTSPSAGRLLTSDATGNASWQPLPAVGLSGLAADVQGPLQPLTSLSLTSLSPAGSIGTGTQPFSVAASGGYAYVTNLSSNSLQIFNVSNQSSPTLTGSIPTGSAPYAVTVSGSYAYVVSAGLSALQIFNISNPASPALVGSATTGSGPRQVKVAGDYAYVTNGNSGTLQVFNVSNPTSPTLVGSIGTGSNPWGIALSGNFAYVGNLNSSTLQIFNVSNPASPTLSSTTLTASQPTSVAVSGNFAYLVYQGSPQMQVFNVSNPAAPTLAGSVATMSNGQSVAVSGNIALVTCTNANALQIFNVSNPASPSSVGSVSTSFGIGLAVSGGNAYVVGQSNLLQVYVGVAQFPCGATFAGNVNVVTTMGSGQASDGGIRFLHTNGTQGIGFGYNTIYTTGSNVSQDLVLMSRAAGNVLLNPTTGNVGIGTSTPTQKLQVNGNICATGTITTCSDARFKEHIEPMAGALETVELLRGVTFDWKRDEFCDHEFAEGTQVGFIAQEVERVLPQVVATGSDGYKSVDYGRLTPVIVEAVKQIKNEKDEQIASLQKENAALQARLDRIESLINKASN